MGVAAVSPFLGRHGARSTRAAVSAVPVTDSLQIIPRDAWAAGLQPTGALVGETVQFLLVHHTAGPTQYDEEFVPGHLRDIYEFHTGPQKNWPDVCYNFFIDRFGRVWEGRAGSLNGAVMADATGGSQGFAQLVCLLGDFTSVSPTPEATSALQRTLAWLADRHGLDTSAGATTQFVSRGSNRWAAGAAVTTTIIAGHRDMSQTACPGDTFYPYVHDGLQQDVHALRGGGAAVPASGQPTIAVVPPTTTTTPPPKPAPSTLPTSAPSSTSTVDSATVTEAPLADVAASDTVPAASVVAAPGSDPPAATQLAGALPTTEVTAEPDEDDRRSLVPWVALAGGGALIGASVISLRKRMAPEPEGGASSGSTSG